MAKPRTTKPAPAAAPGALLGTRHPNTATSIPNTGTVPEGLTTLREFLSGPRWHTGTAAPENPPPIPRTAGLLILRSPGGYILFADEGDVTSDPEHAIAVAATGPDLLARIADWTRPADPAPTPGEAA